MDNNNTWGWVAGTVVVILVILGIWWYVSANPAPAGGTATTTPEVATTTGTGAGGVAVSKEIRTSSTVAQVVASLSGSSNFQSLLVSTGAVASLTGKGPYTLFIPTNAAYASLTPGTIAKMTAAQKLRLAQYAIVTGKRLDIDAVSSGRYTALSKDPINFQVNLEDGSVLVNSGTVLRQYKASNGIVYVMDAVLVPPQTGGATTGSTGTPVPQQ
ncbi:MAG: fasciclin domain-containing protein [Patescibacteria group bacterium]